MVYHSIRATQCRVHAVMEIMAFSKYHFPGLAKSWNGVPLLNVLEKVMKLDFIVCDENNDN